MLSLSDKDFSIISCDDFVETQANLIKMFESEKMQSILQSIEELKSIMENIVEMILDSVSHIIEELKTTFDSIQLSYSDYEVLEYDKLNSPPQNNLSKKMQTHYIFCCLFICPLLTKVIMYCESIIISNYIFEIIKFVFTFFGVYL